MLDIRLIRSEPDRVTAELAKRQHEAGTVVGGGVRRPDGAAPSAPRTDG
jgi:hypothetical protein